MFSDDPTSAGTVAAAEVRLSDVSLLYDNGVRALNRVNLVVDPGETIAIIGPSGSGKSSLLRVIAGITAPTMGSITVRDSAAAAAGLEVRPDEYRRRAPIAMCFQSAVLLEWLTVEQNVLLPLRIRGWSNSSSQEEASRLLRSIGLGGREHSRPHELSGGMKQRAQLVQALMSRDRYGNPPPLILLDEPATGLDELARETLWFDEYQLFRQVGSTVCIATHSVDEAAIMSTRIVAMIAGNIRQVMDNPLSHPRTQSLRESDAFFAFTRTLRGLLR